MPDTVKVQLTSYQPKSEILCVFCLFIQVRKQLGSPLSYSRRERFSVVEVTVTNKVIIASFFLVLN